MTDTDEARIYQCVLGECPGFEKSGGVTNTLKTYSGLLKIAKALKPSVLCYKLIELE